MSYLQLHVVHIGYQYMYPIIMSVDPNHQELIHVAITVTLQPTPNPLLSP